MEALRSDLTPSDYHLFASMDNAFAEQRSGSYEDVKKWLDEWFAARGKDFYGRGIPQRWENVQQAMGHTSNKTLFINLPNLTCFF